MAGFFSFSFQETSSSGLPRMDIRAEDNGGYCYGTWQTDGFGGTYSEIVLTPDPAVCTSRRGALHEVRLQNSFQFK